MAGSPVREVLKPLSNIPEYPGQEQKQYLRQTSLPERSSHGSLQRLLEAATSSTGKLPLPPPSPKGYPIINTPRRQTDPLLYHKLLVPQRGRRWIGKQFSTVVLSSLLSVLITFLILKPQGGDFPEPGGEGGVVIVPVTGGGRSGSGGGAPVAEARFLDWQGYNWWVRTSSNSRQGPGNNLFDDTLPSIDSSGNLVLKLAKVGGNNKNPIWACSELKMNQYLGGYGTYHFDVVSNLAVGNWDNNAVLGLFIYDEGNPNATAPYRELDVEVATWGGLDSRNLWFTDQPYSVANHQFGAQITGSGKTVHEFIWTPGSVSWSSTYSGHGSPFATYQYSASDVPVPGNENVHLNLWLFDPNPNDSNPPSPANGKPIQIALSKFSYTPLS